MDDREVHVWTATLDVAPASVRQLVELLSEDERERAHRLVFERDRRRFIVCRGLLRTILARYVNAAPRSIPFQYNRHGKPALADLSAGQELRFNLAHADDTALYAFTMGRDVGVDVERVRAEFAADEMTAQILSPCETAALRALAPAERPRAFFRCWTRKEAYVKARGEGLSLPLVEFDVSLLPGEPAALLSAQGDPGGPSRWSLRDLAAGPGYAAAICVQGHDWRLRSRRWPEEDPQGDPALSAMA